MIWFLATAILVSITVFKGNAQELEPRKFVNLPAGMNFLLGGYVYSEGGVSFDPSVPLDNAHFKIHSSVFAYARSLNVFGLSGLVDVIVPYAWLSGTADFNGGPVSREVSGLGDPRFRFGVNFLGAPSLPVSEFKNFKQNWVIGGLIQVYFPLGQYDPERLVNIGANRFSVKPELGVSKTIDKWMFEMSGGITFFTVNNNFYQGKTHKQDNIEFLQAHVLRSFKKGMWAAIDATYYWGGSTSVDGMKKNDMQKNTRIGLTYAFPVNQHNSLKFNLSTGVSTRTGSDFTVAGVVWQYRWSKEVK